MTRIFPKVFDPKAFVAYMEENDYEINLEGWYADVNEINNALDDQSSPLCFYDISIEGDGWVEVRYWSPKIQKSIVLDGDVTCNDDSMEDFLKTLAAYHKEIAEIEGRMVIRKDKNETDT